MIAAQTFIRPGKMFLQIDFLLIAMKSKEIPTTTSAYDISIWTILLYFSLVRSLRSKGEERFANLNLNAWDAEMFPAQIFSLCLYWLCTGGIGKHIKQRKCQLLCGGDGGEKVVKESFAIFILSVFHQTLRDEDVKERKNVWSQVNCAKSVWWKWILVDFPLFHQHQHQVQTVLLFQVFIPC